MDTSMLAAGDVAATEGDMVATLDNKVSGGPDATQTVSSEQSRAHVPIGGGHLYIPDVSNNYAAGPSVTIGADETWEAEVDMVVTDFGPSSNYLMPMGGGEWTSGFGVIFYHDGRVRLFSKGLNVSVVLPPSGVTLGTAFNVKYGFDGTNLYVDIDDARVYTAAAPSQSGSITHPLELNQQTLTQQGDYMIQKAKLTVDSSVVFDCDFSASNIGHGDTSFQAAVGGTVNINTSGTNPATIVRKSFMLMDLVDDEYEFTTGGSAINGTIVVATLEGTYSANISLNASTQYDLQARGVASSANVGFLKNVIGYLITPSQLSDSEITKIEAYFVDKGAAARSAFGGVTEFALAWRDCFLLTSFPLIDTSSGENFTYAWYNCYSLTTFPAGFFDSWSPASLNNGVFNVTWDGCTSLTAQSVENILTSLDTSGVYGTNTGLVGGTQLADNTIDIDYDGTTLSGATTTAITSLKSKNWAISINSVIQ
jgi:hypothetical protein